jgi:O-antigen/teichoic acid export membrane protein
LEPEGIGIIDFQNSIINYIVLFTSLGIPFYGVREIAKYRDDILLRNKKTIEIGSLNFILCIFGYVLVFFIGKYVPKINGNICIFYVLSLSIIFTAIGLQWFYQAVEDFKYITLRGIIVRTLCALGLFFFVKDKNDLIIYALIVVGSTVGNNLINFIHIKKYIDIAKIKYKELNIIQHLKPSLKIFVMFAFVSIYIYLNIIILGFYKGDRCVGLFTSGIKISNILNTIITSLGAVMLPRCSNLIENNETQKFAVVITKSYHFVLAMAIPIAAGLFLLSESITLLFCGENFNDSISVVRITSPTIIFVALSNVIGIQILFPKDKEKIVIVGTCVAAIINVLVNIIMIPIFSQNGAALATLLSEFSIFVIEIYWGRKYIPFKFIDKNLISYLGGTILMSICILAIKLMESNIFIQFVLSLVFGILVYFSFLLYKKDEIIMELISLIKTNKKEHDT